MGKSRLVIKYIKNALHRSEEPTIAVSFFTCNIVLDDCKIKLQVSTKRYEAPTLAPLSLSLSLSLSLYLGPLTFFCPHNPIYFINGLSSVRANLSFCCHWDAASCCLFCYSSLILFAFLLLQFLRPLHFVFLLLPFSFFSFPCCCFFYALYFFCLHSFFIVY